MIISMFDKSQLQKQLTYFGDKNEPALMVRNVKLRQRVYIPMSAAWKYDEPDKSRDEFNRLESWWNELRDLAAVNQKAVFHPEMMDVSDDIAWEVALSQFRIALILGQETDTRSLHALREFICDAKSGENGLDALMDMKPFVKVEKVVGEFEASIDGHKFSGDLKD